MGSSSLLAAVVVALSLQGADGTNQQPAATFSSKIDLVRVVAVVRDQKGRFIQNLAANDFEVIDGSERRAIIDFGRDTADLSVGLLFDASGSMEARLRDAREAATHVLSWLDARDEAQSDGH